MKESLIAFTCFIAFCVFMFVAFHYVPFIWPASIIIAIFGAPPYAYVQKKRIMKVQHSDRLELKIQYNKLKSLGIRMAVILGVAICFAWAFAQGPKDPILDKYIDKEYKIYEEYFDGEDISVKLIFSTENDFLDLILNRFWIIFVILILMSGGLTYLILKKDLNSLEYIVYDRHKWKGF